VPPRWQVAKWTTFSANKKTKQKGIFKFPKGVDIGKPTGEYWAEKVASQLAEALGIEYAKVDSKKKLFPVSSMGSDPIL
jgi:hypothetical protein